MEGKHKTDLEGLCEVLVQSLEADFERNEDRFVYIMEAIRDTGHIELSEGYMEKYRNIRRQEGYI